MSNFDFETNGNVATFSFDASQAAQNDPVYLEDTNVPGITRIVKPGQQEIHIDSEIEEIHFDLSELGADTHYPSVDHYTGVVTSVGPKGVGFFDLDIPNQDGTGISSFRFTFGVDDQFTAPNLQIVFNNDQGPVISTPVNDSDINGKLAAVFNGNCTLPLQLLPASDIYAEGVWKNTFVVNECISALSACEKGQGASEGILVCPAADGQPVVGMGGR